MEVWATWLSKSPGLDAILNPKVLLAHLEGDIYVPKFSGEEYHLLIRQMDIGGQKCQPILLPAILNKENLAWLPSSIVTKALARSFTRPLFEKRINAHYTSAFDLEEMKNLGRFFDHAGHLDILSELDYSSRHGRVIMLLADNWPERLCSGFFFILGSKRSVALL